MLSGENGAEYSREGRRERMRLRQGYGAHVALCARGFVAELKLRPRCLNQWRVDWIVGVGKVATSKQQRINLLAEIDAGLQC